MNYYRIQASLVAFYSAVFDVYADKDAYLTSEPVLQPSFCDQIVVLSPSEEKAERVKKKLFTIDREALFEISRLLRHKRADKQQLALCYLREIVRGKVPVRGRFSDPVYAEVAFSLQQISFELEHLKGFLRFTENEQGILYAPYESDHEILDLILPHFERRMGKIPFLIHDKKRDRLAIWNGSRHTFAVVAEDANYTPSEEEIKWQNLWKSYYLHVNIPLRMHEKQMRGSMPVRYWKYMPEKQ